MAVSQAPASTGQVRLLWLIKANEFLLETLKLARQSENNRQWAELLRQENAELKARSTLYEPFRLGLKYRPDQPRVPAGNPERFGGAVARKPERGPKAPDGTAVQLAGRAGGRVVVAQGNSEQPATKFTGETRKFIARQAATAQRVADKLRVSRNAVIGAVANEFDTRHNPDLTLSSRGGTAQAASDWSALRADHQEIADNYNAIKADNPNVGGKLTNPAMIDVGPGNIRIETAIDLLKGYQAEHAASGDDPLDLNKYVGHYDLLAEDLADFDNTDTTFALAALKVRNADTFFIGKDSVAWNRTSDDVKDALRITYYKLGEKTLSKNIDRRIRASKRNRVQFDFDPHGDGGRQHLNNLEEIFEAVREGLGLGK